jgi:hypothetical protein
VFRHGSCAESQPTAPDLAAMQLPGLKTAAGPGWQAYFNQVPLSATLKTVVRVTLLLAPIQVSLGFLSVLSSEAERPKRARQPDLPGRAVVGGGGRDPGHRPVPGVILSATQPVASTP